MDLPVVKQDDAELSVDLHDGFAFPGLIIPGPPTEAKWWVHICGAKIYWVSDRGTWGVASSGYPCKSVLINDKYAINSMHDIGFFVPHLWIPYCNIPPSGLVNLLVPLNIILSQAQVLLGASSVQVNDSPIGLGNWPAVNCSDPVPTPFGGFITNTDVKVGFTWADAFEALKQYAIQVALALAIAAVTKAGGAAWGKIKAKKLAKLGGEAAEKAAKEAAEKAAREAAEKATQEASEKVASHAATEASERAAKEGLSTVADDFAELAVEKELQEAAEKVTREAAETAAEKAAQEASEKAAEEAAEKAAKEAADEAAENASREAAEHLARESAEKEAETAAREAAEKATNEAAEHAEREATEHAAAEAANEAADNAAREASEAATREAAAEQAKDAASKAHQEAVDELKRLQDERAACGIFDGARKKELDVAIQNAKFGVEGAAREFAEAAEREATERAAKEAAQEAGRQALQEAEEAAVRAATEQAAREAAEEAAEKASREAAEHATEHAAAKEAREAAEKAATEMREKATAAAQRETAARAEREAAERSAAEARRKALAAEANETLSREAKERYAAEADRLTREAEEAAAREQAAKEAKEAAAEQLEKAEKELAEKKASEAAAKEAAEKADKAFNKLKEEMSRSAFQKQFKQFVTWKDFRSAYLIKTLKLLKMGKPFVLDWLNVDEIKDKLLKAIGFGDSEDESDDPVPEVPGYLPPTKENKSKVRAAAEIIAMLMGQQLAGPDVMGGECPWDEETLSAVESGLIAMLGPEEAEKLIEDLRKDPEYRDGVRSAFNGPVADMAEQFLKMELFGLAGYSEHELCDIGIPHSLHPYV